MCTMPGGKEGWKRMLTQGSVTGHPARICMGSLREAGCRLSAAAPAVVLVGEALWGPLCTKAGRT